MVSGWYLACLLLAQSSMRHGGKPPRDGVSRTLQTGPQRETQPGMHDPSSLQLRHKLLRNYLMA